MSSAPIDPRSAIGAMGLLTAVGLGTMRVTSRFRDRSTKQKQKHTSWHYSGHRSILLLALLIFLALIVQLAVLISVGGPMGLVTEVTDRQGVLTGLGPVLVIGESTPLLITIYLVLRHRDRLRSATTPLLAAALLALVTATIVFFGGLRGSRSTSVLMIVACIGIYDVWVRPISRKIILLCGALGFGFMVAYGQYKSLGADAITVLQTEGVSGLTEATGRDWGSVLLVDFGRADVQATLLHKFMHGELDLALGRSYVGNAAFVVMPKAIVPDRPVGKVRYGTDALFGNGSYDSGRRSSRIYGLGGEAIINFGALGVPVLYGVYGIWLGSISNFIAALRPDDIRRLMVPPLAVLSVILMLSDTDNALWATLKYVVMPLLAIIAIRTKARNP